MTGHLNSTSQRLFQNLGHTLYHFGCGVALAAQLDPHVRFVDRANCCCAKLTNDLDQSLKLVGLQVPKHTTVSAPSAIISNAAGA